MLRFEILFSSCRNGYKRGNHSALATNSGSLSWGNRNFCPRIGTQHLQLRGCVHATYPRACTSPTSKYERDKRTLVREPTEKRGKVISPFPAFGAIALPAATRAAWNCTLVRLSRHKLLSDSFYPVLSIYFPLSLFCSPSRYSPRSREQLRRQLTVNWTPIISRIAVVSVFRHYTFFFFFLSLLLKFSTRIYHVICFSPSSMLYFHRALVYTHFLRSYLIRFRYLLSPSN